MNRNQFYGINIIVPLILGGLVYLYFRPDTYVSKAISDVLHVSVDMPDEGPKGIRRLLQYYLCDSLWAFALTFSLSFYYGRQNLLKAYMISLVFSALMEVSQMIPNTPGSFDIFDIFVESLVCTIAATLIKTYERRKVA